MIETPAGPGADRPAPLTDRDGNALGRFERDAGLACVAMAAIALVVRGGQLDVSVGVLGGGLLMFASYRAIRGGVDALLGGMVDAARGGARGTGREEEAAPGAADDGREAGSQSGDEAERRRRRARVRAAVFVVRLAGRYALLALGAYVMLVRLRLHPVGLILGVSSPVVAAVAEAYRAARAVSGR